MVVALGPGRFYGSGLPRPRFYTDVKLNSERVDPPGPVMEPLLWWAHDAHWSMGGVSFERHRLQGRIEGSIKKLRAQQEERPRRSPPSSQSKKPNPSSDRKKPLSSPDRVGSKSSDPVQEEPHDIAVDSTLAELLHRRKRTRVVESSPDASLHGKKRARKLGDVFDRIAAEQKKTGMREVGVGVIASRTRSRKPAVAEADESPAKEVRGKEASPIAHRRTSPRKKSVV